MRFRLLIVSLVGVFCLAGLAQPAPPPVVPPMPPPAANVTNGAPKIQFNAPVHDFGKVSAGAIVRANFIYTNIGTRTLEINEVRPSCGCTTAGTWDRRVEPGQTGSIPLQINTANFGGPVTKFVTITCNDPSQPNISLQIKGVIWKPIDVAPNFVVFNVTPSSASNEVRVVKITSNMDEVLEVTSPEVNNPAFRAVVKAVRPGKEFDVEISTVPPLNAGTVQATVTVKTSATNMPVINITAMAIVQPPVLAMPNQLFLPPGPMASPMNFTVTIQNNSPTPIAVPEVSVNQTNVQAQVHETQPGKSFSINLTFPAGFELPPGQSAQIAVKTSNPSVPLLTIPVIQPPRPAPAPFLPARVLPPPPPPPSIARPTAQVAPTLQPLPAAAAQR
jgi:hypothetical protein